MQLNQIAGDLQIHSNNCTLSKIFLFFKLKQNLHRFNMLSIKNKKVIPKLDKVLSCLITSIFLVFENKTSVVYQNDLLSEFSIDDLFNHNS